MVAWPANFAVQAITWPTVLNPLPPVIFTLSQGANRIPRKETPDGWLLVPEIWNRAAVALGGHAAVLK
jgi:hypothetical protein